MYALDEFTVLSLESGLSAPLCTRLLGDMGADVVKVERPGVGDTHRQWDSNVYGTSTAHVWLDRNKRSVEIDLKTDRGRELFLELATEVDVVVQNSSPGVPSRLGVDYEAVAKRNQNVIYLTISGYGLDGPYRDRKAYDLVMQGETGLIEMTGSPDSPAKIPLSICDINAGMYGALSVTSALLHREHSGKGREVHVSMFAGVLSWLGYFPLKYWYNDELPERLGTRHHLITPYGPYETSDGRDVNFAVLSDTHWRVFCTDVIERPSLATDSRFEKNEKRVENRDELESLIADVVADAPRDHWAERLDETGIPWGDLNRLDDVLEHPQTEHLGLIRELDTDDGPVKYIDNPIDMAGLELRREPMPALGEHTDEVLAELGYTNEEIAELRTAGIV